MIETNFKVLSRNSFGSTDCPAQHTHFIHMHSKVWYPADSCFPWVTSVIRLCVWYDNLFFNPYVNHCHPFWVSKGMLWIASLETTETHTIHQATSKLRALIIEDKRTPGHLHSVTQPQATLDSVLVYLQGQRSLCWHWSFCIVCGGVIGGELDTNLTLECFN